MSNSCETVQRHEARNSAKEIQLYSVVIWFVSHVFFLWATDFCFPAKLIARNLWNLTWVAPLWQFLHCEGTNVNACNGCNSSKYLEVGRKSDFFLVSILGSNHFERHPKEYDLYHPLPFILIPCFFFTFQGFVALDLMVSFQTRCTGWSLQQNVMFRGMWPMHLTVGDFERAFTVWLHGFRFGGVGLDFIEYILYILYYIYFILHTFMKSCDPVQHGIVFTCAWISSMNTATWHSESFWSTSNLVIVGARSRSSSSSYHFSTFLIWGNYVRYFPG